MKNEHTHYPVLSGHATFKKGGEAPTAEFLEAIKNLAEKAMSYETPEQTLDQIRITLMVNYGKNGKTIPGLILENDSEFAMMIKVLEHYDKLLNAN